MNSETCSTCEDVAVGEFSHMLFYAKFCKSCAQQLIWGLEEFLDEIELDEFEKEMEEE